MYQNKKEHLTAANESDFIENHNFCMFSKDLLASFQILFPFLRCRGAEIIPTGVLKPHACNRILRSPQAIKLSISIHHFNKNKTKKTQQKTTCIIGRKDEQQVTSKKIKYLSDVPCLAACLAVSIGEVLVVWHFPCHNFVRW